MVARVPGDAIADAFLALAARLAGERRIGPQRLAALTGVTLGRQPDEAFASYQVFDGNGQFHGAPVTANLRAPRRRSPESPLILVLDLAEPLPLSTDWLREQGAPDMTAPPSPHASDTPGYVGFRRGDVLASLAIRRGQLTAFVLRIPG